MGLRQAHTRAWRDGWGRAFPAVWRHHDRDVTGGEWAHGMGVGFEEVATVSVTLVDSPATTVTSTGAGFDA
jgi:hypothetical protein